LWNVSDSLEVLARVYSENIENGDLRYTDPIGKPELGLITEGDYQVALLSPQPRDEELRVATLRITWRPSWGEFYSATSWFEKDTAINADWSPDFNLNFGFYHLSPFYTEVGQQDLSQELRFSSDGSGNFNWLAGAYYLDQDATRFASIPGSLPAFMKIARAAFRSSARTNNYYCFKNKAAVRTPPSLAK
jgi:hypothetical protein